ncbi:YchJ family protein [Parashewanella spongiae]|uniref:YchJ family protein n=1 Tax=Parashewanella spongiae TaxID=342950 RepID=A0A3A6U8M4_9GAMM|nr:YchJ family protein [Parashewanella spongiae]MCL1077540.1 YchJ family protein [Parashewanella spongiae]RJY18280.1 YchJ family protein [Parashewanella spongiae]
MSSNHCPCGSSLSYTQCCQLLHISKITASSPEQLMRSRYSAFVKHEFQYLLDTHAPEFRSELSIEILSQPPLPNWIALEVEKSSQDHHSGTVTFKAWFHLNKKLDVIYEQSNFVLRDGLWYYTDGKHLSTELPSRNDSCICGSGKKFKKCCHNIYTG